MRKLRKSNTIIDIIIALMFISTVLYFCYTLATSSINKRVQIAAERDALMTAENIMNRVLSTGTYTLVSEPYLDQAVVEQMNNIINNTSLSQTEKNKAIISLGAVLPVDTKNDAPFLRNGSNYSYQVLVDDYVEKTGNQTMSKHTSLKRITVNVYYPTKVAKYLKKENSVDDTTSLEEEYKVVTLNTYKSAREYETK